MNKEHYIILGLCVFAFLVGSRLKKKFSSKPKPVHIPKNQRSKMARAAKQAIPSKKEKVKRILLWIQVFVIFGLLIFMIPALSRDIVMAEGKFNQNLVLRILIVALSGWTLFVGIHKLLKKDPKVEPKS
ncbi:MAG: hypothetical protein ACEPOZ_19220 [Marinifilaceae bacterium]